MNSKRRENINRCCAVLYHERATHIHCFTCHLAIAALPTPVILQYNSQSVWCALEMHQFPNRWCAGTSLWRVKLQVLLLKTSVCRRLLFEHVHH